VASEELTHQGQEPRAAGQPAPNLNRPKFRPAFFAGADLRALNQVRSEWGFYDLLGLMVFAVCAQSAVAAMAAVGYITDNPAYSLWWLGLLWGAVILSAERLILYLPAAGRWYVSLVSFLWRCGLAVLVSLLIAEPIVMIFHQPEIDAQMSRETREATEEDFAQIQAYYEPRIDAELAELRGTRNRKIELQQKVKEARRESGEAAEQGLGAQGLFYQQRGEELEGRLRKVEERNEHRQPELHQNLDDLKERKARAERKAERDRDEGNGFEARRAALDAVAEKWPSTDEMTWKLRLLFLVLDVSALLAVILYRLRPGAKPYEERRQAAWEWDSLPAHRAQMAVRVEKQRIADEGRGEMRVNQARIAADVERRIFEVAGGNTSMATGPDTSNSAMDIDQFLQGMYDNGSWEAQKADVPDVLRSRALLGLTLLGGATAIALLLVTSAGMAVSGVWLLVVASALGVTLCAYTGGFREAPIWAIRPILGTFIAGLVLPAFVLAINLF
jgi:hypothetical protein